MKGKQLHNGGGDAGWGLAKRGEEIVDIEWLWRPGFRNVRARHDIDMALVVEHRLSCLSVRLALELFVRLAHGSFAILLVGERFV
jgi:hypothetical protein